MAEDSKIEWTDHTFNPWEGCSKVSPGCLHCYAETRNARWHGGSAPNWGKGAPRRRTSAANWKKPLKWNREQEQLTARFGSRTEGSRPRVFCASLADWLDDEVPIEWLADLLDLIRRTPNLDWLLLTKRPQNWRYRIDVAAASVNMQNQDLAGWCSAWLDDRKPPANVWIGTTVEDQTRADERIPQLLKIPAKVRFLSCEPLLGPVRLDECSPMILDGDTSNPSITNAFNGLCHHPLTCIAEPKVEGTPDGIQWVIAGGESGPGCRPMNIEWARSLKDQCQAAQVPFFMKQLGGTSNHRGELNDFPEDLRVRQFPTTTTP